MGDTQPTLFGLEHWKDIPGYEGHYQASDKGRIRSLPRTVNGKHGTPRNLPGKVLTPHPNHAGYLGVVLSIDGTKHRHSVHRLIATTFLGPLPHGMHTCHTDGDKTNNRVANLYYGTISENTHDRVRHGVHNQARKTHCPRGHLLQEPNLIMYQLERGWRECRSCAWARRTRGDFNELADLHYSQLMRKRAA